MHKQAPSGFGCEGEWRVEMELVVSLLAETRMHDGYSRGSWSKPWFLYWFSPFLTQ